MVIKFQKELEVLKPCVFIVLAMTITIAIAYVIVIGQAQSINITNGFISDIWNK